MHLLFHFQFPDWMFLANSFWAWLFKPHTGCFKFSYLNTLDLLRGSAMRTSSLCSCRVKIHLLRSNLCIAKMYTINFGFIYIPLLSSHHFLEKYFFFPLIWSMFCSFLFKSCWQKRKPEQKYNKQIQEQHKCQYIFWFLSWRSFEVSRRIFIKQIGQCYLSKTTDLIHFYFDS